MAISEETYVKSHDVQLCIGFTAISSDPQAESLTPEAMKRAIIRRMHDLDMSWSPATGKFGCEWPEAVLPPCDSIPVCVEDELALRGEKDPLHAAGADKVHGVIETLKAILQAHQASLDNGTHAQVVLDRVLADMIAVFAGGEPRGCKVPQRILRQLEALA